MGDSRICVLEGLGGRPVIDGDWDETQGNLMRVVQGTYELPETIELPQSPHTSLGRALVVLAERSI